MLFAMDTARTVNIRLSIWLSVALLVSVGRAALATHAYEHDAAEDTHVCEMCPYSHSLTDDVTVSVLPWGLLNGPGAPTPSQQRDPYGRSVCSYHARAPPSHLT